MKKLLILTLLFLVLSACSAPTPLSSIMSSPTPTISTVTATQSPTSTSTPTRGAGQACNLQPIVVPTRAATIPPTNQLDETTGLHMTGTVQEIDLSSYRLKVTSKVDHPLSLTFDELRCLPKVTASPVLACDDLFKDTATWSGVPLQEILSLAGVQAGAKTITLSDGEGYKADIPLEEALKPQNFLAYEWQGKPVPILHGFPLRAVIPDYGGWAWVKWLVEILVD